MVRYITLLLFIGLSFSQEITIAVFDFRNFGIKKNDVELLANRLQSELVKIGGHRFVERKKIDDLFKEQKLQMSGMIDEKNIIEAGKMLGAELIVIGEIGKIGNNYTISARLVNVESSEIIKSANYDAGNSISVLHTQGMSIIANQLIGVEIDKSIEKSESLQTLNNQNKHLDLILENKNIQVLKVKKRISSDGSLKIYITYQQKISYKPSIIMIDWLDADGIPFQGDKKYTESKMIKDEIRSTSFYVPNGAFDYKIWLK